MSNINRDYLCILDVKTGAINAPKMYFYNTDRSTSNIYVQLVVKETIVNATPIENAIDFVIEAKIVKPNGFVKEMTGQLVNKADAIYEFDLPEDFTDLTGINQVEFWVRARVSDREERITSASTKYTVKGSILNSIDDDIKDDNDYPIFLALMERVERLDKEVTEVSLATKALNEEAKGELAKIKADEVEIANNEARRQEQEATRVANEEERKAEELRRKANETAREQAEASRESAEASRVTAENIRESQERDRVSNEYDRQNYEQDREYAENARKEAETARAGAEATRVTAENERKTQETLRQEAEADRVVAEQAREANNTAMRQDITNMQNEISNFEIATNREIEEIRTSTGQEIDTMKVIVENQNAKIDYIKENDRKQDILINGIFNSQDNKLTSTLESNVHSLVESKPGLLYVDEIVGNTMVNCNKEADKSIVLAGAINEEGTNNITLTQGVDGAKADVYVEGNTMVNVCDQEEAVAITKSYTVETGNHISLEGEYDGKCRPVVSGNTLVNLFKDISSTNFTLVEDNYTVTRDDTSSNYANLAIDLIYELTNGKTYTILIDIKTNTLDGTFHIGGSDRIGSTCYVPNNTIGIYKYVFTYNSSTVTKPSTIFIGFNGSNIKGTLSINKNILVLEGDYTNKPIPDYFSGMQSSFEDKVVTQEMVDSGKELAENLGKYKVEYKVTGKNKFDKSKTLDGHEIGSILSGAINENADWFVTDFIPVIPNTSYRISGKDNGVVGLCYDKNKQLISNFDSGCTNLITIPNNVRYIKLNGLLTQKDTFQLEEGSIATDYEPYKESTKTYYLNSPLLEGDTIEESNGNVYHVHRYNCVTFDGSDDENWMYYGLFGENHLFYIDNVTNGYVESGNYSIGFCNRLTGQIGSSTESNKLGTWRFQNNNGKRVYICLDYADVNSFRNDLSNNPIKLVYKLASPTREVISQNDSILQDSYTGGSLDVDTAVPIEKVKFNGAASWVKYLYPSTEYIIQFESDNIGKLSYIGLNWRTYCNDEHIVKGINKFRITMRDIIESNFFEFNGIGFNASNIVVTEATNGDFGYFKGMKSVGEQEGNKIEILSRNKNLVNNNDFLIDIWMNSGGITVTKENDKIILNGTCTSYFDFRVVEESWNPNLTHYINKLPVGTTLTLSNNLGLNNYWSFISNGEVYYKGNTITITNDMELINAFIRVKKDSILENVELKPQIEITDTATDYVPHAENKKQILCDPLRKVGDIADKYVLIDGKWYIERRCGYSTVTINKNGVGGDLSYTCSYPHNGQSAVPSSSTINKTLVVDNTYGARNIALADYSANGDRNTIYFHYSNMDVVPDYAQDLSKFRDFIDGKTISLVFELKTPTYEPIDYNPLDIYSDTTHISVNSNIPAKIKARNHGYNCMLKPSTTYTATYDIDGTPQKTTIVTPETLDDATRFTGTGTLDNFLLLEGDISNPPAFFSGMRSSFDQEYDEVKGKWRVNIRVVGKNKFSFGNLTGDVIVKDIYIPKGTYTISSSCERKYESDPWIAFLSKNKKYIGNTNLVIGKTITFNEDIYSIYFYSNGFGWSDSHNKLIDFTNIQIEQGDTASEYEPYTYNDITIYINEPLREGDIIRAENRKILVERHMGEVTLDGSDDENIINFRTSAKTLMLFFPTANKYAGLSELSNCYSKDLPTSYHNAWANLDYEQLSLDGDNILFRLNKRKGNTIAEIRQYLQSNPMTVVYELAEPIIEEVETDYTRLMLESYEKATVHFNSHIFPTSTIRYQANVISTSEIMSVNDEQDSLLIDSATEIAAIKLTM